VLLPARRVGETFIRREDAERFIEEVRGDDPELASYPRIEDASYLRVEEQEFGGGRKELRHNRKESVSG
jgi:hypothetical protein